MVAASPCPKETPHPAPAPPPPVLHTVWPWGHRPLLQFQLMARASASSGDFAFLLPHQAGPRGLLPDWRGDMVLPDSGTRTPILKPPARGTGTCDPGRGAEKLWDAARGLLSPKSF